MAGEQDPVQRAARVSGLGLLVMFVAAVAATDGTIGRLVVEGDAAAMAAKLEATPGLLRAGVLAWLIDMGANVVVAWGLFAMLRPVHRGLAMVMAGLRLAYVAIFSVALAQLFEVQSLLSGSNLEPSPNTQQQIFESFESFDVIWSYGLVVFGVHILVLGWLLLKSHFVPRFFSILLLIAFPGYLIVNLGKLHVPAYESYEAIIGVPFLLAMVIGEVGLGLWLLVKGVNTDANARD